MKLLRIPVAYWNWIAASFKRGDPSLYGRFDFRYDGNGPAKLLEYNADTPTAVFETGVFQWQWLEHAIERRIVPKDADQFNSLHERLIEAWRAIGPSKEGPRPLHLAGMLGNAEDRGTLAYLEDCARQAGLQTNLFDIEKLGAHAAGPVRRSPPASRSSCCSSSIRGNG